MMLREAIPKFISQKLFWSKEFLRLGYTNREDKNGEQKELLHGIKVEWSA